MCLCIKAFRWLILFLWFYFQSSKDRSVFGLIFTKWRTEDVSCLSETSHVIGSAVRGGLKETIWEGSGTRGKIKVEAARTWREVWVCVDVSAAAKNTWSGSMETRSDRVTHTNRKWQTGSDNFNDKHLKTTHSQTPMFKNWSQIRCPGFLFFN